ncbi:hypothetical protein C1S65_11570 [Pseudomonas putida]|uniref:Uncharacterized protein n=1 Tax=Pseudomonas putida TaxID=303 RepID=A0AAD0L6S7_PSEPU|nr:hypothetical protein C1S65_11570 [Pseudomonas putida]
MKSKMNIKFAPGRQRWMGGLLVSCVLGMGGSPVAWAVEVADVKGPAPTAADNARLDANIKALTEKWEKINAEIRKVLPLPGSEPGAFTAKVGSLDKGDGTFVTTRNLFERRVQDAREMADALGGGEGFADVVEGGIKGVVDGLERFHEKTHADNKLIADSLGGGAKIPSVKTQDARSAPVFTTVDVDANGNAQASVSTSNNVADALVAVGESVKNTANAAVKYDDASNKAQLTLNPGGQAARLSNVQAGALTASSTDAVNGSQLSSSNERIGQLGTQVGELATRTGNDIAAAKAYTDANVVTVRQSIEAVQDVATQTAQAAVKYDDASNKAQLTLNPGGQAARLSNVQAGALTASSTDAVNGSQLSSSNERIGQLGTQLGELATRTGNDIAAAKAYTDANVVTVRQSIEAVQGVATQNAQSVSKVSAEVANLQKGAGGAFQTSARSNLRQPQASGKDAVAGGGAAQAAGDNSVAMGARARAEGSGTTAVGSDAKAIASNSVALGANSVADRSNTVSVGQAGTERQITNVAAGSRGTDAANISQLTRATAAATEQANAYTDQRYAQLHRDLKQQDSTLSAGIAGAMAMANLPRSTVAGGSMTSVAVGNYRGESALAVGVSYVSPSGRWSTNFSGSTNTRNDAGAAVGVGYQW